MERHLACAVAAIDSRDLASLHGALERMAASHAHEAAGGMLGDPRRRTGQCHGAHWWIWEAIIEADAREAAHALLTWAPRGAPSTLGGGFARNTWNAIHEQHYCVLIEAVRRGAHGVVEELIAQDWDAGAGERGALIETALRGAPAAHRRRWVEAFIRQGATTTRDGLGDLGLAELAHTHDGPELAGHIEARAESERLLRNAIIADLTPGLLEITLVHWEALGFGPDSLVPAQGTHLSAPFAAHLWRHIARRSMGLDSPDTLVRALLGPLPLDILRQGRHHSALVEALMADASPRHADFLVQQGARLTVPEPGYEGTGALPALSMACAAYAHHPRWMREAQPLLERMLAAGADPSAGEAQGKDLLCVARHRGVADRVEPLLARHRRDRLRPETAGTPGHDPDAPAL